MKKTLLTFLLFLFTYGCGSSQEDLMAQRSKLAIFHSNDIMGYLTPCG